MYNYNLKDFINNENKFLNTGECEHLLGEKFYTSKYYCVTCRKPIPDEQLDKQNDYGQHRELFSISLCDDSLEGIEYYLDIIRQETDSALSHTTNLDIPLGVLASHLIRFICNNSKIPDSYKRIRNKRRQKSEN